MWYYEKKTQYPVKIEKADPRMAINILTQYGGPYFMFYKIDSDAKVIFTTFIPCKQNSVHVIKPQIKQRLN
jgi:spore coat protein JC